jgi:hypothetical protein
LFAYTRELVRTNGVRKKKSEEERAELSHLLYDEGNEPRDHFIDDAFVTFFVAYVVAPCRQGYGNGVRERHLERCWIGRSKNNLGVTILNPKAGLPDLHRHCTDLANPAFV